MIITIDIYSKQVWAVLQLFLLNYLKMEIGGEDGRVRGS